MNAEIRDALPDLVHGRLGDLEKARVIAHVESCADCRAELELLREVRASAPAAPPIDAARIAARIPAYAPGGNSDIMIGPSGRQRQLRWTLAAAVALIAFGGLVLSTLARDEPTERLRNTAVQQSVPTPAQVVAGPTEPASTQQRDSQPAVQQVAALSLVAGVSDLGDAELETLLDELDRMESLPSAEPEPVTIGIEDIETER